MPRRIPSKSNCSPSNSRSGELSSSDLGGGNSQALKKLTQLSQKYNATVHQLALSWLLHRSPNILLIPGTSKVKHLEENYAAAAITFAPEDLEELEKLK